MGHRRVKIKNQHYTQSIGREKLFEKFPANARSYSSICIVAET